MKNLLHISGTGVVKSKNEGIRGQILLGASLGPIFSTYSPTYSLIIATILPLSLQAGTVSIFLYALGLGVAVLLVAIFGRTIINRLHIFCKNDPRFKQILAVLIIMVGIFVITGHDKHLESMILGRTGNSIIELEENILKSVDIASPAFCQK